MTVYYWEDGPRARFEDAAESLRSDSSIDAVRLSAYGEGVILEGIFTLKQLEVIVRAMRAYEKEVAGAKAAVVSKEKA